MFEFIERFLGGTTDRDEPDPAARRLVELDRKAIDRDAFRAALEERDFERAAEYHEFSAGELRATVEDTLGAVGEGGRVGEAGPDVEDEDGGFGGDGGGGGGGGDGGGGE